MTTNYDKKDKAARVAHKLLSTTEGQLLLEYLRSSVRYDSPLINSDEKNINKMLLLEGGRQLFIEINDLIYRGKRLNKNL